MNKLLSNAGAFGWLAWLAASILLFFALIISSVLQMADADISRQLYLGIALLGLGFIVQLAGAILTGLADWRLGKRIKNQPFKLAALASFITATLILVMLIVEFLLSDQMNAGLNPAMTIYTNWLPPGKIIFITASIAAGVFFLIHGISLLFGDFRKKLPHPKLAAAAGVLTALNGALLLPGLLLSLNSLPGLVAFSSLFLTIPASVLNLLVFRKEKQWFK